MLLSEATCARDVLILRGALVLQRDKCEIGTDVPSLDVLGNPYIAVMTIGWTVNWVAAGGKDEVVPLVDVEMEGEGWRETRIKKNIGKVKYECVSWVPKTNPRFGSML